VSLQIFVTLEHFLDAAGDVVMFLADDLRCERARVRRERIDGGKDSQLSDGTFQHDRRVEVRERRCRRGVGQVVRGDVDRLEGRN
jgi:hypothetical protein